MRIAVSNKSKKIHVYIPTCIAFNIITASITSNALKQEGISISAFQLMKLFGTIKQCRRIYPGWKIVEVREKNGEEVTIQL